MGDRVRIGQTRWYWRNCPSGIELTTDEYPDGEYLFLDLGHIEAITASGVTAWAEWVVNDLRQILADTEAAR